MIKKLDMETNQSFIELSKNESSSPSMDNEGNVAQGKIVQLNNQVKKSKLLNLKILMV